MRSGDGCSNVCYPEDGFSCSNVQFTDKLTGEIHYSSICEQNYYVDGEDGSDVADGEGPLPYIAVCGIIITQFDHRVMQSLTRTRSVMMVT